MKTIQSVILLWLLATGISTLACGDVVISLEKFAREAISPDAKASGPAIEFLRASGQRGLDALLTEHAALLKPQPANLLTSVNSKPSDSLIRLKAALDAVSQQRDCYASHLFWHTDLEQAKAAARASGKPILSLRLLGRLDEEFSCANSRFFRTTLYANREVSKRLRNDFILHWKSVRPVPKITIDFGDGRKIERTITGNSIHYILDADGRVIDALPGLYGPREFMDGLTLASQVTTKSAALSESERSAFLVKYHGDRIAAIAAQWTADLNQVGKTAEADYLKLELVTDDSMWQKIAALPEHVVSLDAGSIRLIGGKNPDAFAAGRVAVSKSIAETPLLRSIRKLQCSIAEDTVRNEYSLHTKIHEWLASGAAPNELDALNAKIYAELFLTPDSDPWLGLVPRDTIAGLDNNGIVQPTKQ